MASRINTEDIKERYNSTDIIWDESDFWHYKTKLEIESFVKRIARKHNLGKNSILNLGSAGNSYGMSEEQMLHVDVVEKHIKGKKNYIVSRIEDLDIEEQFDCILCVGSVINYSDPFSVIQKCSNLITDKGLLILEFENSRSWEFIFTDIYNKNLKKITTFYQGSNENIFVYSESFIKRLLKEYDFEIIEIKRFHLFSSLVLKITQKSNKAVKFTFLDTYLRKTPYISKRASNVIILASKKPTSF